MAKCECGHPCENYPDCIDYSDVDYWECPECGNTVSPEEAEYELHPLCARCPSDEYTTMEPVWLEVEEDT